MQGRDLATLEKIDEERYMRAIAEKEIKDRKGEELKNMNIRNTKNNNLAALQQQMSEKQQRQMLQKMEDDAFANIIKQKVQEGEMLDAQKREELNMRAKKFVQGLNVQMYETEQKKKYGGLMTEHERRVNDADIKAYEDQD